MLSGHGILFAGEVHRGLFGILRHRGRERLMFLNVDLDLAPMFLGHAQFGRELAFGRIALQLRRKLLRRRFRFSLAPAGISRRAVEPPQAVEHRSSNPMPRIDREDHPFTGFVFRGGIDQADHALVDQVLQIDVNGKALLCTDGDCSHQRQMLQNNAVPRCSLPGLRLGCSLFLHDSLGKASLTPKYWHTLDPKVQ